MVEFIVTEESRSLAEVLRMGEMSGRVRSCERELKRGDRGGARQRQNQHRS